MIGRRVPEVSRPGYTVTVASRLSSVMVFHESSIYETPYCSAEAGTCDQVVAATLASRADVRPPGRTTWGAALLFCTCNPPFSLAGWGSDTWAAGLGVDVGAGFAIV